MPKRDEMHPEAVLREAASRVEGKLTHRWSIAAAWLVAVIIGVLSATYKHGLELHLWNILTAGLVTIVTFVLQLITADKNGFIVRLSLSIAGAFMILFMINFVTWLVR